MESNQFQQLHQWLESQKAHWHDLLTGHESAPTDWQAVLDSCKDLAQKQSGDQAELTESMVQQIKGFSHYGEQLLRSLKDPDASVDLEQAVNALSNHLHQQAGESFYRHGLVPEPLQQLLQQLGLSPSSFSSFPFLHQGIDNHQQAHRDKQQQFGQALTAFGEVMQRYIDLHQQINLHTDQLMIESLNARTTAPESLSELHGIWVDCYEQSYQQQLSSSEYQQVYGRLTNATLTLQQQLRQYWQQEHRAIGLVPLEDYDKLLQSYHQLRKSHKQSQRSINQLQQTVEQQQQQLHAFEQRLQQLSTHTIPSADHSH